MVKYTAQQMQTLADEIIADHSEEVKALSSAIQTTVKDTLFNEAIDSIFNIQQEQEEVKEEATKISSSKLTKYTLVQSQQGARDFYIVPKTTKGKKILDELLLRINPNRVKKGILKRGINSSPLGDKMRGFVKNSFEAKAFLLSEGLTLA